MATATLTARGTGQIHVKYRMGGGRVMENFSTGAIAVINDKADVLDQRNKIIFPTKVVICRRVNGVTPENSRLSGTPITAQDPGENHNVYILTKAKASAVNPIRTVQKDSTRPVGECPDANPILGCKSCCNYHHREK